MFRFDTAYQPATKHYPLLTPCHRHMGNCIACGNKKILVNECFKDSKTCSYIFDNMIGRLLRDDDIRNM